MGLFSFLRRKEPENYEETLENLRLSIQSRQSRLSEIRLRERRMTLLLTSYAFAAWALYLALWYVGWLPDVHGHHSTTPTLRKAAFGAPVIIGPIIILFTRRIVQSWYSRIGNAEEETLKKLLMERRHKVEELKKKTDYYSTQKLLERYDQLDPSNTPQKRPAAAIPDGMTPPRPMPGAINMQTPPRQGQAPNPSLSLPLAPSIPPPQRHWYDRIVDAVLGEDTESPHTRFALICQRCFTHNGLIREAELENTQYVCMKCGHLNTSPRQRQLMATQALRLQSLSPQNHAHGPLDESPAVSARILTDDEKTNEQTGKSEVDES